MTRNETIKALAKYFDIKELVDQHTYMRFGQSAWKVFDTRLLEGVLVLRRDILKVPLVCNNWHKGGAYSQRGFRCNISPLVADKTKAGKLYITAHGIGQGLDFSSPKMTADEMRKVIEQKKNLLPHPSRIENGKDAPTWLHYDVMTELSDKLTVF
jgi:hypothetical protein